MSWYGQGLRPSASPEVCMNAGGPAGEKHPEPHQHGDGEHGSGGRWRGSGGCQGVVPDRKVVRRDLKDKGDMDAPQFGKAGSTSHAGVEMQARPPGAREVGLRQI